MKKAFPIREKPYFHVEVLVGLYNLLFVVRTASLTNSVRHHQCAAFAALYQCRSAHFPVCSSLISSTFGRFILRTNRHCVTPPYHKPMPEIFVLYELYKQQGTLSTKILSFYFWGENGGRLPVSAGIVIKVLFYMKS